MIEDQQIKGICFWQSCIQSRMQVYTEEQRCLHDQHSSYCYELATTALTQILQNKMENIRNICANCQQMMVDAVDSKLQVLQQILKDKYHSIFRKIAQNELNKSIVPNYHDIIDKIKKGYQNQQHFWFINTLFHNQIPYIRQLIETKFIFKFRPIFKSFDQQIQIITDLLKNHDFECISQSLKEDSSIKIEQQISKQPASIQRNLSLSKDNKLIQTRKHKGILKDKNKRGRKPGIKKAVDKKMQLKLQDQGQDRKAKSLSLQYYQINNQECLSRIKKQNINSCERLVINHFIGQDKLIDLINGLNPSQVTINTQIDFKPNFLSKINRKTKQKIRVFEEYWDFNESYQKYINYKYFPSDEHEFELRHKLHFKAHDWRSFPNLQNIWISSQNDLDQLRQSKINYDKIKSLRIQPCECCRKSSPLLMNNLLSEFRQLKQLQTFMINQLRFSNDVKKFLSTIITNNQGIKCLILNNNDQITNQLINLIAGLPLDKLFIHNYNQPEDHLNYTPIFGIQSLRFLTLQRARFSKDSEDENATQGLIRLSRLIHLNLYDCTPVTSRIFEHFHQDLQYSLTHLNLGYSEIGDRIAFELPKFQRLKRLNLDGTNFTLFTLLKELKKSPLKQLEMLSLFNYQIEQKTIRRCRQRYEMTNDTFNLIANAFPNIVYLTIGYDSRITRIDLTKLKYLKFFTVNVKLMDMIVVSKQQKIQIFQSNIRVKD